MKFVAPICLLLSVVGLAACSSAEEVDDDSSAVKGLSVAARKESASRGKAFISEPLRLSAAEVKLGPKMKKTYAFNEEVACDFVEPDKNDQLGGLSPKFNCKLANGDIVKVKYSCDGRNDVQWTTFFRKDRQRLGPLPRRRPKGQTNRAFIATSIGVGCATDHA